MGPHADLSGAGQVWAATAEQACARGESGLALGDGGAAEREFVAALSLIGDEAGGRAGDDVAGATALRVRVHVGLGRVRLAAGDAEQGAVEFGRAHEVRPDDAEPLHWLGCAAAHRGAFETAEAYFTSALGCESPHRRSLVQRAYVRVRLRSYAAALDDLRAAASGKGELDVDARWVMRALSGGGTAGGLPLLLRKAALAELSEGAGERGGSGTRQARAARLADASRGLSGPVVERDFVPLYAVVLVRGGRREAAVELLEAAARSDPADHRITHTLALALLNSPSGQGRTDGDAGRRWERCIAAWGALLHDDAFWEHRRASALARFGVPVQEELDAGLRADLRELLERRMPEGDVGGRVPPGALLQREADAAKILAGVGGFAAGRGESPLVCGPLRVAGLGLVEEFGAFAAAGLGRGDGGPDAGLDGRAGRAGDEAYGMTQLTYAFSELGLAQLLLNQGKPADALASLGELRCRRCRERLDVSGAGGVGSAAGAGAAGMVPAAVPGAGDSAPAAAPETTASTPAAVPEAASMAPVAPSGTRIPAPLAGAGTTTPSPVAAAICEPDCGRFDELNPSYAGHPDKHHRLARDARTLALRARMDLGRGELTSTRPDFAAAADSWRRALVHGRELARYRETQAAVVDLALGAARAAHRAGDATRAVDTLEAVRAITGANERGRLEGQLARLLADRAISAVNRDGTLLDAPAQDLRRSVAFNPHLLRAQVSLAVVLRGLAARRWRSGSVSGARATLQEALDQLAAALFHFPDDPELTEQRDAALADLDHVTAEQQESGR
ncbi:tetratricopeptide repeat protein [Streptomyces sp. NPDC057302]|uniref:CHAT domain-containing protein n=1 Tax=Streptomyces sp. NPDC057302 TaxID=3346094 RepID=UPI00363AD92D